MCIRDSFKSIQQLISDSDERKDSDIFDISSELKNIDLVDFDPNEVIATRKAFGMSLDKFSSHIPTIVGGSADLDGSNCTTNFANTHGDFSSTNLKGRNIPFGVREFPMGAIMNGISLYGGLFPFGGTFLVFSDYVRSAIRLSAIQKLHVMYEFTHDSIFVGEDGPTHQPIEHIMSLRLIPNLLVFRPADAIETHFCFETIMENDKNPSAILLTRQKLPVSNLDKNIIKDGVKKGAYTILESHNPELVIFTTGSEAHLALSIAKEINNSIKIVNIPCWELFEKQSEDYKKSILTSNCKKRVSLEAGTTLGWEKFVGQHGLKIGIDDFGLSAPGIDVVEQFDFTKEKIIVKITEYLNG